MEGAHRDTRSEQPGTAREKKKKKKTVEEGKLQRPKQEKVSGQGERWSNTNAAVKSTCRDYSWMYTELGNSGQTNFTKCSNQNTDSNCLKNEQK